MPKPTTTEERECTVIKSEDNAADQLRHIEDIDRLGKEAYQMGYDSAIQTDTDNEVIESFHKDSAQWANHTAPRLRALAGYVDTTGKGTYTGITTVAITDYSDDRVNLHSSHTVYEYLVEQYDYGRYDKRSNNDKFQTFEQF